MRNCSTPIAGGITSQLPLAAPATLASCVVLEGVPVARRQNYQIDTPGGTSFLMGRIPGPNGDIRRMHGEIDEVTVYNRALLPSEIAAIFLAGQAGKCKP